MYSADSSFTRNWRSQRETWVRSRLSNTRHLHTYVCRIRSKNATYGVSERTNVWKCMGFVARITKPIGSFSSIISKLSTYYWTSSRRGTNVAGESALFIWRRNWARLTVSELTHLTCDMIQKRRVVVTSSIGFSVRAISVLRANKNLIIFLCLPSLSDRSLFAHFASSSDDCLFFLQRNRCNIPLLRDLSTW